ncbi:hypothetical protein LEP1GSC162_2871 [Leptospira santarosai str. CBC1531]|nr:hypothetical protein LEP1GSC162_2871 [Leptospira santarosai str. CBC1531]
MNVKFDLNPFQFRIRHDVSFFVQKNFAFLKGFGVRFEFRFLRPRGIEGTQHIGSLRIAVWVKLLFRNFEIHNFAKTQ